MVLLSLSLIYGSVALFTYWISQVIYSLYFSPLKDIPGPLVVHFFPSIRMVYLALGIEPRVILNYHLKYGPVVRIGKNEVSFCNEDAAKEIYSTYSYPKSANYDTFATNGATLFNTRDKEFHRKRKRIMAPAFGQKPLENVEPLVQKVGIQALADKIHSLSLSGEPINLFEMFHFMAYDIIGELAFGRSFEMLENKHHPILEWISFNFRRLTLKSAVPFFKSWIDDGSARLINFATNAVKNAKSAESRKTVLNFLIEAVDAETGENLTDKQIARESLSQIVAGTDTTSNTLTWTFYFLLKNPQILQQLSNILKETFPDASGPLDYHKCRNDIPYLSAVIHESMRLLPVASATLFREVPSGGRTISNHYIPEKTNVGVTILAIHNVPWNWKNPEVFDPTRWLDQDGNFSQKPNFMPFSMGPRACVGRNLAWMELYLVVATLARKFQFTLHDKDLVLTPLNYVVTKPSTSELNVIVSAQD